MNEYTTLDARFWEAYRARVAASVLPLVLQIEAIDNTQYRSAEDRAISRSVEIADKLVQRLKGGEK